MHRTNEGVLALSFVLAAALPVLAGTAGSAAQSAGSQRVTPAEAARYEAAEQGEHEMSGTITRVDHEDGMLRLATEEALLELPFKPASIQSLRDGEKATVQLAYVKLPVAKTAERHEEAGGEAMRVEHWMKGTVQDLDRKTGIFTLDAADVTARLHFPPSKISTLQNGDEVAVEVALAGQPRR
jgi:hypothetical protein